MTFSNLVPDPLPVNSAYVPRVFGFRVHPSARQRDIPPPASAQATASVSRKKESGERVVQFDGGKNKSKSALSPAAASQLPPQESGGGYGRDAESGVTGLSANAIKGGLSNSSGNKKPARGGDSRGDIIDGGQNMQDERKPSSAKRSKPDGDSGKSASAGENNNNENGLAENKMKRPKRQNVIS